MFVVVGFLAPCGCRVGLGVVSALRYSPSFLSFSAFRTIVDISTNGVTLTLVVDERANHRLPG